MDIERQYMKLTKQQRAMVVALADRYEWQVAPYLLGNRPSDGLVCRGLAARGIIKSQRAKGTWLYMVTPLCLDLAEFAKTGRRRIFGRTIENWQPGPDHIQVVERAAEMFGISTGRMLAKFRDQTTLDARTAAILAIHKRWPDMSYARIGKCVARDDHSTIIHALERAFRKAEKEAWFREVVEELCEMDILPLAPPNNSIAANCARLQAFWAAKDKERKARAEFESRDDGWRYSEIINMKRASEKFIAALKKERPRMHFAA